METSESGWVELPDLGTDGFSLTVAPASAFQAAAAAAPRRSPLREVASWRVLKMWEDGTALADAGTVRLIGVNEGRGIIVSVPEQGHAFGFQPTRGALYRFRSFSGESIYEFSALLVRQYDEPYPHLHFAWPLERHVRNRNLRAAPRVKADLPCMVYPGPQTSGRFAKGMIVDLSTSGAAIRLNEHLNIVHDEVRVVFRLSVGEDEVLLEARARAVRRPEENETPFVGVAFSSLALSERLALHAYVQTVLVRDLEVPLYAA
jgi:c-di-GMP-binding flagellar brake protein YcgR